jgi:hypothetical protein
VSRSMKRRYCKSFVYLYYRDLERELDSSGKGRFRLADMIGFCKLYNIDLNYQGLIRKGTVDEMRD